MEASTTVSEPRFASDRGDPTAGVDGRMTFVPTPLADPGPLGLAAFALTTFVLSMFNADLVGKGGEPVVLGLAVAFTSFGSFWLSYWAFVQFFEKDIPAKDVGHAVGLYLIAWGIFTTYMFVASLRTTGIIAAVFFALAVTFFLLGIGNAGEHTDIVKAGGWAGLITAALAWYGSFAAVTNSTFGRVVLPVRPLARG